MHPGNLVLRGVGSDVALEVDVVTLFDVVGVELVSQLKTHLGRNCRHTDRNTV